MARHHKPPPLDGGPVLTDCGECGAPGAVLWYWRTTTCYACGTTVLLGHSQLPPVVLRVFRA